MPEKRASSTGHANQGSDGGGEIISKGAAICAKRAFQSLEDSASGKNNDIDRARAKRTEEKKNQIPPRR